MTARSLLATLLIALASALPAVAETPAEQNRIRLALAALENLQDDLFFIGYQSVQSAGADGQTYMLLDFRYDGQTPRGRDLYASIDRICRTVLTNTRLVQDLSNAGYDMVSVAFDERSQYDCLP